MNWKPLPLFSLKILHHIQIPDNHHDGRKMHALQYEVDCIKVPELVFEISRQTSKNERLPIFS